MSVPVFQSLICCFNGSKFRCILSTPTLRRSFRSAAGGLVEDGREVAFEHVADRDLISDREGQPHRLVIGIAQADREADVTMFVIEVQHTEHSVHLSGNPVHASGR